MLGATSVSTWADVNYNFGSGSTWTVKCSGSDLNSATGVVINVAKAGDLAAISSSIVDAWGNGGDKSKGYSFQHIYQKSAVVKGNLSASDMAVIYGNGTQEKTFCTCSSLNLSGVTTSSSFDNIKNGWAKFAWCHNNSSTSGLVVSGSSNSGNNGGSTEPTEPTQPSTPAVSGTNHVELSSTYTSNDVATIHTCGASCSHSLEYILSEAHITSSTQFDLVKINLDYAKNKVEASVKNINSYAIDLTGTTNMTSANGVENEFVSNVILPSSVGKFDLVTIYNFKNHFNTNNLVSVIAVENLEGGYVGLDTYINKPGQLANGLQYVSAFNPSFNGNAAWYNKGSRHNGKGYGYNADNVRKISVAGCVFAIDLKATYSNNVTAEGHLMPATRAETYQDSYSYRTGLCTCKLAPSANDPHVHHIKEYATDGSGVGALLGAHITHFDFTNAEFGEYVHGQFEYYPADMTISELQYLGQSPSAQVIKLPTNATQYIIPEGFIHDSKYIHEICIPHNITEIHRFAFLGAAINGQNGEGGINRYTTTAAEDGEQKGILAGEVIDNGPKTLTLPSTTKYIGRGAFSGYGGAALIEDVYVLAPDAPYCEFYAFDQKSYVGQDSHTQEHLIRKGNYVNPGNGMAMLHFPNTTDQRQMLNYSDMTRKYRLYDETGKFDNLGNILVWPTQAQYNRSFNQALAGVTWAAWKENLDGIDNPEDSFDGGAWVAGSGDKNANHEAMFALAASKNGYSEAFIDEFDRNPSSSFDGSEGKGDSFGSEMEEWDQLMLSHSKPVKETDRPLTYDWQSYGGWHQFTIAELYDFMLELPGSDPTPKPDYFNFGKYSKNIWYTICFPFNMTKAQVLKAFGDVENDKYPVLATLAGVTRNEKKLEITIHMSKDLMHNKVVYESGKCSNTVKCVKENGFKTQYTPVEYADDDIVIEANKPYFILPCLPEDQLALAATGQRKSEISVVKQEEGKAKVMFPIATHVHAINGTSTAYVNGKDEAVQDTAYAFNYYFVGNYIPQDMPENAYYLGLTKKSNGDWWSSFFRNSPKKANKMWTSNSAIVMAVVENKSNTSQSKGVLHVKEQTYGDSGVSHNYIWNAEPYNDYVFFYGTGHEAYAKSGFGMSIEKDFTTNIQLPEGFEYDNASKIYNLNGQFVGIDSDSMPKGVYILNGKKIVVK